MNTQTQTTVTELLDPIWIEVVTEQLQAYPTSVALVIEPEILGRYHAQLGLPCEPYKFYRRLSDVNDYTAAYEGTTALWAAMVEAKNEELCDTFDYEGALQELIDGREDEEWIRRGC